ncbi:MAG TPA: glucokinase [Gemmataceae bacterium]|nr:glucokinase [Gemmataceae bacterium]
MILAGDIGGTKTVIAHYDESGGKLRQLRAATFKSKDYPALEKILAAFLKDSPGLSLRVGCFGVAGAVIDGKSQTTNLPWQLDEQALARAIGVARVKLLNDLEAAAYGMLHLSSDEMCVLNAGTRPGRKGHAAVIAAGTGLGEAMLYWDGQRHHPLASEGGHADFAPRTDQEIELLRYLRGKCGGHVSYERVLSGPGFYNVYCFLRDSGHAPEPAWLTQKLQGGDPNPIITQAGLAGEDPLCVATVELFSTLYGAEAGNLALKCVATGGVFVGGGIAPKMLSVLQGGSFMRGFTDKGRFSGLMKSMGVSVALNPAAPLIGAAHYALQL